MSGGSSAVIFASKKIPGKNRLKRGFGGFPKRFFLKKTPIFTRRRSWIWGRRSARRFGRVVRSVRFKGGASHTKKVYRRRCRGRGPERASLIMIMSPASSKR